MYSNNGEDWCQVMHKDSTKMNAIRKIAELLSVKIENIVAFGDDSNDIEMIRSCGIGVAVENAIDSVKQAADYICCNNDNDGVAKWIKEKIF